jgi:hypothetical protein
MSIIENLKGRTAPKLSSKTVAADIEAANNELAELKGRHGAAALAVIEGVAGADKAMADLNARITVARERIATLQAAQRLVLQREEAEIAAQRASLHKTQIAALKKHLDARDAAVVAFVSAMEEATKHYHDLLDRSAKAKLIKPILSAWPEWDDICEPMVIRKLAAGEFFRLSAAPGDLGGRALPGASFLSADYEHNPGAIPPMADAIKQSSAGIMAKITGKASE